MSDAPPSANPPLDRDADAHRCLIRERYADIAPEDGGNSRCPDTEGSEDARCDDGLGTDSERLGCGNPDGIADHDGRPVAVRVEPEADSAERVDEWDDERDPSESVVAPTIEARKPAVEQS